MVAKTFVFSALTAAAIGAQALSTGCTTTVAGLALGDLGSCLQLTSALKLFDTSGAVVSNVESYLSSLCASSTPTCSNSTLTSAQSSISSSCASDVSSGGTAAAEIQVLDSILANYPEVYSAACSKNQTTGDYCVVSTLYTIQNVTGTDITVDFLTGLLSGSGNTSTLSQAFSSGELCTGCVAEIYHQALQVNSTIAQTVVGSGLSSQCGSNFGTADATSVSVASVSSTAGSAASTSATGAAGPSTHFSMAPWLVAAGTVALGGVIGSAVVL